MRKQFFFAIVTGVVLLMGSIACKKTEGDYKAILRDPELYHASVKQLTDIIVHDIFSPPVASRIYVYPNIAAFEVLAQQYPEYISLAGQINGLQPVPGPEKNKPLDLHLSAIHAFLTVGKALIFSEETMDEYREQLYGRIRKTDIPKAVFENSLAYGEAVATHILQWASADNYKQTRSFPKYTIRSEAGFWKPTPPDYMEGIEPHWPKIRTLALDSCSQFSPAPPHAFSMEKGSPFYKETMEVYEMVNQLNEERTEIAKFWDCNPYVSHHHGHAMFAAKKITPGGHWMGITSIATRKAKADMPATVEAYARVAIALFDGFISCWDEKWRSIVARPETVINEYVDEDWVPLLQTPPFPEYTSGHSVISNAAAAVLTDLFGSPFAFTDSTEVEYGLPVRSFDSFHAAGEEAAISRLYAGIHYRRAVEEGKKQGKRVGEWVVGNVQTRKNAAIGVRQRESVE